MRGILTNPSLLTPSLYPASAAPQILIEISFCLHCGIFHKGNLQFILARQT